MPKEMPGGTGQYLPAPFERGSILRFRRRAVPFPVLYVASASWLHGYATDGRQISFFSRMGFVSAVIVAAVAVLGGWFRQRAIVEKARRE